MSYVPHSDREREEMLRAIGVDSFEELLEGVPERLRLKSPLNLPEALSELEAVRLLDDLARRNKRAPEYANFMGGRSLRSLHTGCRRSHPRPLRIQDRLYAVSSGSVAGDVADDLRVSISYQPTDRSGGCERVVVRWRLRYSGGGFAVTSADWSAQDRDLVAGTSPLC